jgi:hypothetical protein
VAFIDVGLPGLDGYDSSAPINLVPNSSRAASVLRQMAIPPDGAGGYSSSL